MIDLLGEGVRSSLFPCSLAVLAPGVMMVLLGRGHRALITVVYVGSLALWAWVRFSGFIPDSVDGTRRLVAAALLAGGLALAVVDARLTRNRASAMSGAAILTAASSAWWWVPCVGLHFGTLLASLGQAPGRHIPGLLAYSIGLFLPLYVVLAVGVIWVGARDLVDTSVARALVLVVGGVMVVAMIVGRYDDLIGRLWQLST